MLKKLMCFIVFITMGFSLFAQVPTPAETRAKVADARAQIQKRNVSDAEIQTRMKAKGIDINNIRPEDADKAQAALNEVLADIDREQAGAKNAKPVAEDKDAEKKMVDKNTIEKAPASAEVKEATKKVSKTTSQNVIQSVKEGATVEEAVAEEIIEAATEKAPEATIYGQQVFRNKNLKIFRNSEDNRAPDTYIIGSGDKMTISLWGTSQENATYEISKDGCISPTYIGRICLKGITYGKAKEILRNRYAQYYRFRKEDFDVAINFSRNINVNIVGEVLNQGSFFLPAINTAFNALIAAGGPSNIGSVRNIQLKRATGETKKLDVYEFLNNPTVEQNFYLLENDYVFVPLVGRLVNVKGGIKRPFKYELIPGENLAKTLEYAGGFTENAIQASLQVKRFKDDKEVLIDVDVKNLKSRDFELLNGDEIIVKTIPRPYENFAEIIGEVENVGKYQITQNMKLTDLVKEGILRRESKTDIAILQRLNTDQSIRIITINLDNLLKNPSSSENLVVLPKDKITVYTQARFTDKASIAVSGSVRAPIKGLNFPDKEIRVNDMITLAGGLKPEATDFAYIYRVDLDNQKKKEYVRINIKEALSNPKSPQNMVLKAFDELVVPSNASYFDQSFVNIAGAVRNPGKYQYDKSLSLSDVLRLSGGLKIEAATNRVDVYRLQIKDNEPTRTIAASLQIDTAYNILSTNNNEFALQPFDQIIVRNVENFELIRSVSIQGEVKYPGPYALTNFNETIASVIGRAGGLGKEAFPEGATLFRTDGEIGHVVLKLEDALKNGKSEFNIILKQGDVINIPKSKDLVSISGAVRYAEYFPERMAETGKVSVAYQEGKTAQYYIKEYAGGLGEKGIRSYTVEYPNGKVKKTRNYGLFKIHPKIEKGASIFVAAKVEKPEKEKEKEKGEVNWDKLSSRLSFIITMLIALRGLTQ
jgi:protein involved in polysaccharide export with SLBB domain